MKIAEIFKRMMGWIRGDTHAHTRREINEANVSEGKNFKLMSKSFNQIVSFLEHIISCFISIPQSDPIVPVYSRWMLKKL